MIANPRLREALERFTTFASLWESVGEDGPVATVGFVDGMAEVGAVKLNSEDLAAAASVIDAFLSDDMPHEYTAADEESE